MRRAIALGALTLLVLVPVATGCGSTAPTPTVPTPDFSPDAIDTTQIFDTGTMEPGDETTLLVVPDGDLKIADLNTDREVTVTVTPSAS